MKSSIAHRRLFVSEKGRNTRHELSIHISHPRFLSPTELPFTSDVDVAACNLEIVGFKEPYTQTIYGADLIQALQLAVDIDPILESYTEYYDLYFEDGEPYFEDQDSEKNI